MDELKIFPNKSQGPSAELHPDSKVTGCFLHGLVKVGKNSVCINSTLENCTIGENVKVTNSVLKDCTIGDRTTVGPFANLRNNAIIGRDCRIGNFVEIKNSTIKDRTKVSHLAYIGDAEVGEDTNVGCGVIFCNYSGAGKFKTTVGDRVFLGCNCNLVAPVSIADDSFVAAGTTVTKDVKGFAIGRAKQENKMDFFNPYLENFKPVKKYFGTDGIRGKTEDFLTPKLARSVGNAVASLKPGCNIVIGRDTRPSGKKLSSAFITGAKEGGATVYDLGMVPTSCVSYLTKLLGFDFGIVITASHNPPEYNGIKVFASSGIKLGDSEELKVESRLNEYKKLEGGKSLDLSGEVEKYKKFLIKDMPSFKDLTIALDMANGASEKIAPEVFKKLGAKLLLIGDEGEINKDCGCTHIENLVGFMKTNKADLGFAFDGDADRTICVTKDGSILDGDNILYMLARFLGAKEAVGTVMTNSRIEKELNRFGISLKRTKVGDKYIIDTILKEGQLVGGEQAGHMIITQKHVTGDGILTALYVTKIFLEHRELFDEAVSLKMMPQVQKTILVEGVSANRLLKEERVASFLKEIEKTLEGGRIVVRASGTEPKIRIMVETEDPALATQKAEEIYEFVEEKLKAYKESFD